MGMAEDKGAGRSSAAGAGLTFGDELCVINLLPVVHGQDWLLFLKCGWGRVGC